MLLGVYGWESLDRRGLFSLYCDSLGDGGWVIFSVFRLFRFSCSFLSGGEIGETTSEEARIELFELVSL